MVCESVGPITHEVSVPFHDSQVRGVALLIQTGWDKYWGTDAYWKDPPFLADHLIFRMVRSTVKLVGVDFPVTGRSAETRLVTTGKIPIVENLRGLSSLPRVVFTSAQFLWRNRHGTFALSTPLRSLVKK
jgi:kynurenine formamidase